MIPKILDGKQLSLEIKSEIKNEIDNLNQNDHELSYIAIIQVGDVPASSVYINNKKKAFNELGIKYFHNHLSNNISEKELLCLIRALNNTNLVSGIFVQLPLPKHISEYKVFNTIDKNKDIDCFNPDNIGKLYLNKPRYTPCTPTGIIELLKRNNIEIEGKNCVIIGRSDIVGKPLSLMLLHENASVTVLHSKSKNIQEIASKADILITAIGKPKFIDDKYIKPGAVVIDVGINIDENNKLCGDVDFDKVYPICSAITPVPGGVGPMTVTMLMKNCLKSLQFNRR